VSIKYISTMKKNVLFLVIILTFGQIIAQKKSVWHEVSSSAISKLERVQQNINTEGEGYFSLDIDAFKLPLATVKDKFSQQPGVTVEFPNKKGEIEQFQVWENSNMEPDFQAQFPQIRAYVGKSVQDGSTINFSVSPRGVQTVLFRPTGETEFIEAVDMEATAYVVYDTYNRNSKKLPFNCSTIDTPLDLSTLESNNTLQRSSNRKYKTMRLALSCTAEYANVFGATSSANVALVIAAMNATMTRVNGVCEKDLAVHFNMITNTSIIYYNAATDPYSDAASMGNWNGELQSTLTSVITEANYDIGHLFGATGGGGNAGCIGCVCVNGQKGSGITSPGSGLPQGDNFDIDYVVHEMGHQMGGNHSFTFGYEGSTAQVEPGSGSTIMGYAGITSYDVQTHSDPIFCYKNILQIQTNLNSKTCPVTVDMVDNTPTASAGSNYTIPQGTAFMLTGTASDLDTSDVLTYLWEQNNVGTSATAAASSRVLATKTAGPNFRTFKPSNKLVRYFPQMGKILSATLTNTSTTSNTNWESVSTVARTLNFTFTVRDNVPGGGQTATASNIITVSAAGGPFAVTSQSTTGLSFPGNSTQAVTWNVAGTTVAPFNSPTVDILITTNASTALETFNATTPTTPNPTTWTTLATGVPNNGSYTVTLPNVAANTTTCRFMVKAVGNVFLAVNSKNFTITPALANEEFGLNNFAIYPNPNNGNFTVQFDSVSDNEIVIGVNDIRGRAIFSKTYQNTGLFNENLKLDNLQAGIYLVTVQDGSRKEVKKIVVE
jgi:hypothetical protein